MSNLQDEPLRRAPILTTNATLALRPADGYRLRRAPLIVHVADDVIFAVITSDGTACQKNAPLRNLMQYRITSSSLGRVPAGFVLKASDDRELGHFSKSSISSAAVATWVHFAVVRARCRVLRVTQLRNGQLPRCCYVQQIPPLPGKPQRILFCLAPRPFCS